MLSKSRHFMARLNLKWFCAATVFLIHKAQGTANTNTFAADTSLDTYTFTTSVLYELTFDYGELCFVKCNQLLNCNALTVSFKTRENNCVLYSKRFGLSDLTDAVKSNDSRYFYLPQASTYICQGAGYTLTSLGYCIRAESQRSYTKAQAQIQCQNDGGNLVIINSPTKQGDIVELLQKRKDTKSSILYIDGYLDTVSKRWKWWDGTFVPMGTTYWHPGQPDNKRNIEECIVALFSDKRWYDVNCSLHRGFICEKPLTLVP